MPSSKKDDHLETDAERYYTPHPPKPISQEYVQRRSQTCASVASNACQKVRETVLAQHAVIEERRSSRDRRQERYYTPHPPNPFHKSMCRDVHRRVLA